jgi:hypothetical protein
MCVLITEKLYKIFQFCIIYTACKTNFLCHQNGEFSKNGHVC